VTIVTCPLRLVIVVPPLTASKLEKAETLQEEMMHNRKEDINNGKNTNRKSIVKLCCEKEIRVRNKHSIDFPGLVGISCVDQIESRNRYSRIDIGFEKGGKKGEIKEYNYRKSADMDHANEIKDPEEEFQGTSKWSKEVKEQPEGELADRPNIGDCGFWRYQTGDKESNELPISDQEVIQNTEYAESGECVMSEVGYINKCVDIAKVVDNKIVNYLFDPGGKCLPKHPIQT
ncbi:4449_t:CDS:2, partial [Gigaspora margarita]